MGWVGYWYMVGWEMILSFPNPGDHVQSKNKRRNRKWKISDLFIYISLLIGNNIFYVPNHRHLTTNILSREKCRLEIMWNEWSFKVETLKVLVVYNKQKKWRFNFSFDGWVNIALSVPGKIPWLFPNWEYGVIAEVPGVGRSI